MRPPSEYVGQTIGNYRIVEKLGAGGMGIVYKAEDIRLGRFVALKMLVDASVTEPRYLERFRRETRAASSLSHPNICTVYDVGEAGGAPYLILELLEGETLAQKISGCPLPLETTLNLGIQICDALACAHGRGIIHRDVKPSNIFVTNRGDAKLLDFGLSKIMSTEPVAGQDLTRSADITQKGYVVGTMPYMSPEQIQGQTIDSRSDIFSLGAVLYEMATGICAFDGSSPPTILAEVLRGIPKPLSAANSQVPPELQRIVSKAIEKDPGERYQSVTELKIDLRRLLKEVSSAHIGPPPNVSSQRRPSSATFLSYGLLVAFTGIAIVLAVSQRRSFPSGPLESQQLTFSPEPKEGPLFTDGARLYFTSNGIPAQMSVNGGTIVPARSLPPGMQLLDLFPDGSQMLALQMEPNNEIGLGSMWIVPTLGGPLRRVGNDLALTGRWSPDGHSLAYSNKSKLYVADADGAHAKNIWTGPSYVTDLCFSPDSKTMAATLTSWIGAHVWSVKVDGTDAHPLPLKWPENVAQSSPQWTSDGRHFIFTSDRGGRSNVYEVVPPRWYDFWQKPEAVRLTGDQLDIEGAVPARDSSALFVMGQLRQGAMHYLDQKTKTYLPFLGGLPATAFVISPDQKWIAYSEYPGGYLWKCKPDGSERLQLTHSPAAMLQWSPDSKSLVFSDWRKLYVISSEGGVPEKLIDGSDSNKQEVAPTWSPDGKSIYFNYYPYPDQPRPGILVLDLASRKLSVMPGSEGFYVPLWSPDGKYQVAIAQNPSRLMLYSADSRAWSELKRFDVEWSWFVWTRDSKGLYVSLVQGENGLYQIGIPQRNWTKLSDLERTPVSNPVAGYISVTPEGQPAIMTDTGVAQIYALRWR